MKVTCIIQARMGSTRLPGKVMGTILDKPMLWWDVYRVRQCELIDDVVIATTMEPQDDIVADLCSREGWSFYRGSVNDVLDRYYRAASLYKAARIVRITADCPLIDPDVTDYAIAAYLSAAPAADYASNILRRTYPRGLDVEIFSFSALEKAWKEDQSEWREHVTPYMYKNTDEFKLVGVTNSVDFSHHRWTVDTPEDFTLVRRIYGHFGHGDFRWREVLTLLDQHPDWVEINKDVEQKKL